MIPEKSVNSVSIPADYQTKQFGIDTEDFSHLVDLVQNQLYSNKILAVIREYSCNAKDSNVMAGKGDVPIRITLPSKFDQQFKVRDFGHGLTQNEMESIFTRYGKSTKRLTNEAIGALGIGCKSFFSYSPSFIVNSFQKGIKTSYNCVLDETNVGKLIVLGTNTTTEPDGLEIVGAVKNDDITTFREEAVKFFKFWDVMPDIEGFTPDDYAKIRGEQKVELEGNGWSILTDTGYSWNRRAGTMALMGNICYPIVWGNVKGFRELLDKLVKNTPISYSTLDYFLSDNSFLFKFGIGEVKMSPNREALQYTDLTNNAILSRIELMFNELAVQAQSKMDGITNLWDAKNAYDNLFNSGGCLQRLRGFIKLKWQNTVIEDGHIKGFSAYPTVLKTYHRSNGRTNFYCYDSTNSSWNTIECIGRKMILEVDQTSKVYIQKAVRYLADTKNVTTVYVLNFTDATQRKDVFAATGLDDCFITKYSTIADAVKNTIIRKGANGVTTSKADTTERSLKYVSSNSKYNYYRNLRDLSSVEHDMVAGGIYVETEDNEVVGNRDIRTIVSIVEALGKHDGKEVVVHFIGQNLSGGKLMSKGAWVSFDDYVANTAKKILATDSSLGMISAYNEIRDNVKVFECNDDFVAMLKDNPGIDSNLDELVSLLNVDKTHTLTIVGSVKATDADKKKVKELYKNIMTKYPMFKLMATTFSDYRVNASDKSAMIEYLKNNA